MCGITGVYYRNGSPIDPQILLRMTRELIHRGPDEEGFYINRDKRGRLVEKDLRPLGAAKLQLGANRCTGHVGFGHRRLSIIDLASGQQPLSNEDGSIWITFNGEIYNFKKLIAELENRGHRFRTQSDTEAIVHAYEEWGCDAIPRLRGMFAFALWDQKNNYMLLARDRVGKKPLYYCNDKSRFLFGSELKAILAHGQIDKTIDLTALSDYISLLYVPSPKTIFKSIRKLPAGHYMLVSKDDIRVIPYWDLDFRPTLEIPKRQMMEEMLAILDEATQIRRISEVPLGAFLSGGVDSSAVVALMAKAGKEKVLTNSISFGVSAYDEAAYAKRVAELFDTDHHEYRVAPQAISIVDKLAWHYDEPFADSSAVPTYYVSETARKNVTVALSGDGGDENFAGYRRYYFDQRENMVRNMFPAGLRRPLFRTLGRLYPKVDYLPQIFRGKAFISNLARDPVEAYFFSVSSIYEDEKRKLLNADVSAYLKDYRTSHWFHDMYRQAKANDHLSKIQYLDIKTYLCEDILTKVDRASMAVSLEVRCPILDHHFMEYVARIPFELKLSGLTGKKIFKEAMADHLPKDILYRKKMGFAIPISEWFRNDLKTYGETHILNGNASKQYIDSRELKKAWQEHQSGVRNKASLLWSVLMLNLWHDKYVHGESFR